MTLEQYKLRNAENREHMEKPMAPFDSSCVSGHRESAYLPGGEKRSMAVEIEPGPDLSHLNPAFSKKFSQLARRGQKRRMKK